jgi:hypothetical protein
MAETGKHLSNSGARILKRYPLRCSGCTKRLGEMQLRGFPVGIGPGSTDVHWTWKLQRRGAFITPLPGDFDHAVIEPERVAIMDGRVAVWGTASTFRRVAEELEAGRSPTLTTGQRRNGNFRVRCACGRSRDLDPVHKLLSQVAGTEVMV